MLINSFSRKEHALVLRVLLLTLLVVALWRAEVNKQMVSSKVFASCDTALLGKVSSIPTCQRRACRFQFEVQHNSLNLFSTKLLLRWYGYHPWLHAGELWYLSVQLSNCHNAQSRPRWLLAKGDSSAGYVINRQANFLVQVPPLWSLLVWREHIQRQIYFAVTNHHLAAIIAALTVGSRALLRRSDWQVFQYTGTSHLVAISGLHVGLIFWFVARLLMWLCCCSSRLVSRCPAPILAEGGALVVAVIYGLLAGMSLPTERALIMLVVMVLPKYFYRTVPLWRRLLMAFVIMIVLRPISVLQIGFWLSFTCVATILYCAIDQVKNVKKSVVWLKMQMGLSLLLLPLTLFYFAKVSLLSSLANLVAVPWVSFIIVPLAFIATVTLGIWHRLAACLYQLSAWLLWPLWWYLEHLAAWPWSHVHFVVANLPQMLFAEVGMMLLLLPKGLCGRCVGLLYILPLFAAFVASNG